MVTIYDVVGFQKRVSIRILEKDVDDVKYIVAKSQELYESESHFIRCAVRKLIREEKKRLRI